MGTLGTRLFLLIFHIIDLITTIVTTIYDSLTFKSNGSTFPLHSQNIDVYFRYKYLISIMQVFLYWHPIFVIQ